MGKVSFVQGKGEVQTRSGYGGSRCPVRREECHPVISVSYDLTVAEGSALISSLRQTAPAMTMIMAALSAYLGSNPCMLPAFEGGNLYQGNMELVDKAIIRTLSAYAIILALVHCHRSNNEFTPVKLDGSYLPNLLLMMGFVDTGTGEPDPKYTSVMRKKWVISADHGMTNSTSAFLHTASTQADPISCLVSALSSSYGPLHFGATEISYRTLQQVARPENVPALIARAKAGELRLPGVGHRMYKLVDPRLKPVLELLQELKEIQGKEDPLIATAREIHRLVAVDEYFTKRRLFVNADLYWVFIYTAMYESPFFSLHVVIREIVSP